MVLRPTTNGNFEVVGDCYVPDLNDARALLGPLPYPWRVQMANGGIYRPILQFYNTITKELSNDDPRLENLSSEWTRIERKWTTEDPTYPAWYENEYTREIINSDPRMSQKALEARGIRLKTFQLV